MSQELSCLVVRRWRPREPDRGGLVDECEAFLCGRYADYLHDVGVAAPSWTWVNELAHRTPSEIRLLADGGRQRRRIGPWSCYIDTVAKALSEWARSDLDLERWQAEVLVPFELSLIERNVVVDPRQLVQTLLEAVVAHRRERSGRFLARST
jgi:hypothetical protein